MTELMCHDKDRVNTMLEKRYEVQDQDLRDHMYARSDSGKLVMIITKNTPFGCISQKYTLLSTRRDVYDSILKLSDDFSQEIADFARSILNGGQMYLPSTTLYGLLTLAQFIISEYDGVEAVRHVPIYIYDFSCNNFYTVPEPYRHNNTRAILNEEELLIIHMANKHLRDNEVAFGGKKNKKPLKTIKKY